MPESPNAAAPGTLNPMLVAVLANRFEAVVREMTNTLLRTARSAVVAVARDFSCSIATADDQLLAAAEGLPVHVIGSHLQTAAMREFHPDLREGDAYLDNDPYRGNTHAADHTILVPVFVDGVHLFTACAKAHQADIGNSIPSSYHPLARDFYEEGALAFSVTQVQRDYEDIDDIIRMCRLRIRVPDQWYGDYLAMLGAARIAERRLKEVVAKYGREVIDAFVVEWLDYSERRMEHAIRQMPAGTVVGRTRHDPFGPLVDGVPLAVSIAIDPAEGVIDVDLRDNVDCLPAGINESMACSINSAVSGVLNVLEPGIPVNSGSFRRLRVHLRENCVVGIPLHPTSCSLATTNIADRLINMIQHSFADVEEGHGMAEGGAVIGPGFAVVSGTDRRTGQPYINQLVVGANGGPATPGEDGWLTYNAPSGAGLIYRDSVEVDEHKYPMRYRSIRVETDTGGAGAFRGAPSVAVEYGPTGDPMTAAFSLDGYLTPARGARGGGSGSLGAAYLVRRDGEWERTENMAQVTVEPGEWLRGEHGGGGGYGDPLSRDPERVRHDVAEGYVSRAAARIVYGVELSGSTEDGPLVVDVPATDRLRTSSEEARLARSEDAASALPEGRGDEIAEPDRY